MSAELLSAFWRQFKLFYNNNNNNNNNGFIRIAARMLDYTISATQDSA